MDQLLTIPNLSIAELRKVLQDNDIKDTSQSKEDLIQQVTEFCLTKIAMDELNQEQEYDHQESIELSKGIEASRIHADRELLDNQQREYEQCLEYDLHNDVGELTEGLCEGLCEGLSEEKELTTDEIREIRLKRFA